MRPGDFEHDFVVCRGMEGAAGEHERIVGKSNLSWIYPAREQWRPFHNMPLLRSLGVNWTRVTIDMALLTELFASARHASRKRCFPSTRRLFYGQYVVYFLK